MRLILFSTFVIFGIHLTAQAQNTAQNKLPSKKVESSAPAEAPEVVVPAKDPQTGAPILQFNNLGTPAKKDERPSFKFKVPMTESEVSDKVSADPVNAVPHDEPFKAYLGYPKNSLAIFYRPTNINAKWEYSGTEFNFNSNSAQSFGLLYRFMATPMFKAEIEWNSYSVSVADGTANSFSVLKSDANIQSLFIRAEYSWFGSHSFYHRYGLGIDIGNDSYPILDFGGTSGVVQLSQIKDIVVGLNAHFHYPLIQSVVLQTRAGYNIGTGGGNSGDLTSKKNSSYFAKGLISYAINDNSSIEAGTEYRVRMATVSGRRGNNTDEWKTTAVNTSFDLGYNYTF